MVCGLGSKEFLGRVEFHMVRGRHDELGERVCVLLIMGNPIRLESGLIVKIKKEAHGYQLQLMRIWRRETSCEHAQQGG